MGCSLNKLERNGSLNTLYPYSLIVPMPDEHLMTFFKRSKDFLPIIELFLEISIRLAGLVGSQEARNTRIDVRGPLLTGGWVERLPIVRIDAVSQSEGHLLVDFLTTQGLPIRQPVIQSTPIESQPAPRRQSAAPAPSVVRKHATRRHTGRLTVVPISSPQAREAVSCSPRRQIDS